MRFRAPLGYNRTMRILLTSLSSLILCGSAMASTTLIRGGHIVDGTGNAWFAGDVLIEGDRIKRIGTLGDTQADRIIDAAGLIVAPGFIDVHTHVDDDILKHPLAENFVRNGVTTIVSGNCGGSETDVGGFFKQLRERGSAINNATLIGHNSVLRAVKGPVADPLSAEQLEKAKSIVDRAMRDGAIGLSTGLIYTPGEWSETPEIIELAKVAGRYGGIYATHMRSESTGILKAIDEAIEIGKASGCRVQISHFKLPSDVAESMGRGKTLQAGSEVTLRRVDEARAAGLEVWIDQYPYTASSTTINTMLPDWVLEKGPDAARSTLKDPAQVARAMEDMKKSHEVARKRTSLAYAVITSAKNPRWNGKSVLQIAQMKKFERENPNRELLGAEMPEVTMQDQYQAVIDLYLEGGAGAVFHTMDETEVANILKHPLVGIASDSGMRVFGQGVPHPRGYGTNTRILGRYVRELKVITLEDAVRKMTSLPATAFRMKDRGVIREGAIADVTIFDAQAVADKATFENPHQYPVGIRTVMVSGTVIFDGEKLTGEKPGQIILGPGAGK
jgi:N-acyl-D-amino-acid deacylase